MSTAFEPSAEEARRLLREELSDRVYREAEPNWFDRLVSGFLEWLGSLAVGDGAAPAALLGLLLVLVVGAAIAAILIFGLPGCAVAARRSLRSSVRTTTAAPPSCAPPQRARPLAATSPRPCSTASAPSPAGSTSAACCS